MAKKPTNCAIKIKCGDIMELTYNDKSLVIEDESSILALPSISKDDVGDWLINFSYKDSSSKLVTESFTYSYLNSKRIYALQYIRNLQRDLSDASKPPENGKLYFSIILFLKNGATCELEIFAGTYGDDSIWIRSENILNYAYEFGGLSGRRYSANYCLFIVVPPAQKDSDTLDIYTMHSDKNNNIDYKGDKPSYMSATLELRRQF